VRDRGPERVDGLAAERPAALIDDRHRQHDRQPHPLLLEHFFDRDQRRPEVERVGDRLGDQQIDAPVDEAARLIGVGGLHLVEGHGPERGVVHVGRHGQRPVGRSQRPGHEARLVRRLGGPLGGHALGEPRRLDVELVADRFEVVVRLGDGVGVEGVGLDDVAARGQVLGVDVGDDLRLGQHEEVVVAAQLLVVVREPLAAVVGLRRPVALDHRPHRAVEQHDALGQGLAECLLRAHRRFSFGLLANNVTT